MRTIKIFAITLLSIFSIISCKKNEITPDKITTEEYNFSASINNFTESLSPISSINSISNLNYINSIQISIYDELGYYIYGEYQTSINSNFGKLNTKLKSGKYTIVVLASNLTLPDRIKFKENISTTSFITYSGSINQSPELGDIFYKKEEFNLDNNKDLEITLDRITSKLNLKILGKLPINTNSLEININSNSAYSVRDGAFSNSQFKLTYNNLEMFKNEEGFSLPIFILPNNSGEFSTNIKLSVFDSSNIPLSTINLDNIFFKKNHITTVTGSIKEIETSDNGIVFKINLDWDKIYKEYNF